MVSYTESVMHSMDNTLQYTNNNIFSPEILCSSFYLQALYEFNITPYRNIVK